MKLQTVITFDRDVGRHEERLVEVHMTVAGSVFEDASEYIVVLASGLDLQSMEEQHLAEQALIRAYLAAHPYVLAGVAA